MQHFDPPFSRIPLVTLVGPTAIGKTALSLQLAKEFNFEIISVDSMQVYRYMDIGTAKITRGEMNGIPHHLLNVVNPDEPFNAGLYEKMALKAVHDIASRGKRVLITGGTGLYLRALLSGLSQKLPSFPAIREELEEELLAVGHKVMHETLTALDRISAKRIHANDTGRLIRALEIYRGTGTTWSELIQKHRKETVQRFPNVLHIGLTCDREKLYKQIELRTHQMLEKGLEKEVEGLLRLGYGSDLKSMQAIGYKHMTAYLDEKWDYPTMTNFLVRDTRRYAKRQYTWFKSITDLNWFEKSKATEVRPLVLNFIKDQTSAH